MTDYCLSFKPALDLYGGHDPSAAIFEDGALRFGVEEERFTREKHAVDTFPRNAIEACLDHCDLELPELDRIVLPYDPSLMRKQFTYEFRRRLSSDRPVSWKLRWLERLAEQQVQARFLPTYQVERELRTIGSPLPPVEVKSHHECHAASCFHPSGFDEALVVTIDGKGEYDSTVVWKGTPSGLTRLRTYEFPNSLGHFYGIVTEYLGYRAFNGEGKVMGLAPYGERDPEIEAALRQVIETGVDYQVTELTGQGIDAGVEKLEDLLSRSRNENEGEFDDWHQNFAHVAQALLEDTLRDIVEHYCRTLGTGKVCFAGGVALNCKANKRVMELDVVDDLFVQPVAHDGGLAIGGGYVDVPPRDVSPTSTVYRGPEYGPEAIESELEKNKIPFSRPDDLERTVARRIAEGDLVGWYQGRLEMGPRALGNRSILADPRTEASRDRVNRYVKHREEWRPFAPSMLEEAAPEYLVDGEPAPFMIKTFEVDPERESDLTAVLHPGDNTTRPQTVNERQNPRYHRLLSEFEDVTGVPVLLNTSFNDHGEPIVTTPKEAIKDFYGMGLDLLVMGDVLVRKDANAD